MNDNKFKIESCLDSLKNNLDVLVNKGLEKAKIVTREEFDIQKKVLLHTRIKIEDLEKKIDTILSKLD